jgi:uncharacterized oxidoreductase
VAGRQKALDQAIADNPGMAAVTLGIEDPASIRSFADRLTKEYPALNLLINNAGIMRAEKLLAQPNDLADAEAIIAANLPAHPTYRGASASAAKAALLHP